MCAYTHRFFSNLLAVVFILLNLNAIMSVIFNVPAAIFSTVRVHLFPSSPHPASRGASASAFPVSRQS